MTDGISMIRRRAASMTNELKAGNSGTKSKSIEKTTSLAPSSTTANDKLAPGAVTTTPTVAEPAPKTAAAAAAALAPSTSGTTATSSDPINGSSTSDGIVVDEEEPFVVVSEVNNGKKRAFYIFGFTGVYRLEYISLYGIFLLA